MTAVLATELKTNFKEYAGIAAKGEPVLIKRPKKEDNLVLINENEYNHYLRMLAYFAKVNGYRGVDELMKSGIEKETFEYGAEFKELFGSLSEEDLAEPADLSFSMDSEREVF